MAAPSEEDDSQINGEKKLDKSNKHHTNSNNNLRSSVGLSAGIQANGLNSQLHRRSSIQKMLESIKAERRNGCSDEGKNRTNKLLHHQPSKLSGPSDIDDDDYVLVHSSAEAFWTSLFSKYFICQPIHDGDSDSRDDLLFFVRYPSNNPSSTRYGSSSNLADQEDVVQVFRKDSKRLPSLGDPSYNWEETVYLNLILQQFEYSLTCAVCSRTGDRELQILKKSTQKVYASPSHRSMESKGTGESISYPNIFFTVDNFEEVFGDIVVRDSEMVCVELVASDRQGDFQAVIFTGSIKYEALKAVFDSRQSSLSAKMRHSFSWGVQGQKLDSRRTEFIRMRGPQNKGHAEMAISRQKGVPDTPLSTPLVTPQATPHATPRATPAATPDATPRHSPDREELPPFPVDSTQHGGALNQQNSYNVEERRFSETSATSALKSGFKWGFGGIRKSQSASDRVSQVTETGEVEAKSISEELHQQSGQGLFGRSFGQAWHWFKEQRRAASVGLNSCLTYVTLPWHRIIGDVMDTCRSPALSF